MCQPIFAQGSHDLQIGERKCQLALQTGVSCLVRNSVPMNNAARRAQGLPEDPNEPKGGEAYLDYLTNQLPGLFKGGKP